MDDTTYNAILERVADGELVTDVVKEYGITRADVWRASEDRDGHTSLVSPSTYMRARISQAHSMAEDTILISDGRDVDGQARMLAMVQSLEGVNEKDKQRLLDSLCNAAVARDTLRVNTRKFLLAKIAPKIYGEPMRQVELSGPGGGAIPIEDVTQLRQGLTARLAGIASRRKLLTATATIVTEEATIVEPDTTAVE